VVKILQGSVVTQVMLLMLGGLQIS